METDPTPPPYETDTEITSNDKSTQVAPAITESEPGPGSEQVEAEEEEPHVVVYVSLRNDKSGKSPNKFRSSREAIMLSPSSTYKKLSRLLDKRLSNHKYLLHLPEDDELRTILYYTIQDGGRDPWLDSNWHNNVRIFDEQSWKVNGRARGRLCSHGCQVVSRKPRHFLCLSNDTPFTTLLCCL